MLRAVQGSVIHFEEYQFARAVRVQSPQCHGGNHGAEESPPQNLSGKIYANFLRSTGLELSLVELEIVANLVGE